jgi:hypothetical protein
VRVSSKPITAGNAMMARNLVLKVTPICASTSMPETTSLKITLFLGDFVVEEVSSKGIAINIGHNVRINVHPMLFGGKTSLQRGDKVPLYTEIPVCPPLKQ